MILASERRVNRPNSAKSSLNRCSGTRSSGNTERIRPANEMSRVSTTTPAASVKALTIGSKEKVARRGASSVWVYMILGTSLKTTSYCFKSYEDEAINPGPANGLNEVVIDSREHKGYHTNIVL